VAEYRGFSAGIGMSYMLNPFPYNGSNVNAELLLGYRYGSFQIQWKHWSNAGARMPNYGRDVLFVGYRF
jgi:hypothetical protein